MSDPLADAADAISTASPNIRAFAQLSAARTIALEARVTALEKPAPPPPAPSKLYGIAPGAGPEAFNYLSPSQLADYLDRMKAIGVRLMRFDHWGGTQAAADDARDTAVVAHGMDAIVMIANGSLGNAKQIATTALRHGFHKYELGNEPNINLDGWGNDPARYVAAANAAYDAVKSVDPHAIVGTGGLAPYGQYGSKSGDGHKWDMQVFFSAMLAAGAHFDVVPTHPYFFGDGPLWTAAKMLSTTDPSSGLAQSLYLPHSIAAQLDAANRHATPIWFTEVGAPSQATGWAGGVTEQAQAGLVSGLVAVVANEPRVPLLAIYSGKDKAQDIGNREGHFGLFRTDWSAKPAALAFRTAVGA